MDENEEKQSKWRHIAIIRVNLQILAGMLFALGALLIVKLAGGVDEPAAFWALLGVIVGKIGDIALKLVEQDKSD